MVQLARPDLLIERFSAVRSATEHLMQPLHDEDMVVQSMPDASPTKWHAAHTTWFFETFVLERAEKDFKPFHPAFRVLFNSYYQGVGAQADRAERGLLSRPTVREVRAYRADVDARMRHLLNAPDTLDAELQRLIKIGLQHEQQHQELLLTDIKHAFSKNPLLPAYTDALPTPESEPLEQKWLDYDGGIVQIGFAPTKAALSAFAFDNEQPRHDALIPSFALSNRPVTNGEFAEFIRDGGYTRPEFWHAEGWQRVCDEGWSGPLYWQGSDPQAGAFTLNGLQTLDPHAALAHVSWFEASAYAAWAGARLPTEFEWEHAATSAAAELGAGNFAESRRLHPTRAQGDPNRLQQLFGDVWEWTASPYAPYPGFRAAPGIVGEYNSKFMCNQQVLRGGSCVTPASHIRATYRNYFPAHTRWQFSGFRLARDR